VACLAGCGRSAPDLANAHPTPEALASAVLSALERQDAGALRALALTEQEFRDHVWPELPAARPERNLPFSYVWGDLHQKSEAALTNLVARHGARRYALLGITFAGETTGYPSYEVHRESVLRVRGADGGEEELRLFGSAVQKDGAWKVFSYIVDE
jgi:hypothetical protein